MPVAIRSKNNALSRSISTKCSSEESRESHARATREHRTTTVCMRFALRSKSDWCTRIGPISGRRESPSQLLVQIKIVKTFLKAWEVLVTIRQHLGSALKGVFRNHQSTLNLCLMSRIKRESPTDASHRENFGLVSSDPK